MHLPHVKTKSFPNKLYVLFVVKYSQFVKKKIEHINFPQPFIHPQYHNSHHQFTRYYYKVKYFIVLRTDSHHHIKQTFKNPDPTRPTHRPTNQDIISILYIFCSRLLDLIAYMNIEKVIIILSSFYVIKHSKICNFPLKKINQNYRVDG